MRRLTVIILPIILVVAACRSKVTLPGSFDGVVSNVHDGDTIKVVNGNQKYKIRLAKIDAPELEQEFGSQARDKLKELCDGKTIHVMPLTMDRYSRVVADLTVNDTSINQAMVRDGCAWWYESFDKVDPTMENLQQQARIGHTGLWQAVNPEPPWIFRKEKKEPLLHNALLLVVLLLLFGFGVWYAVYKLNRRRILLAVLLLTFSAPLVWDSFFNQHHERTVRFPRLHMPKWIMRQDFPEY